MSYYSTIYANILMTRITPLLSYYCHCICKLSFLFSKNYFQAMHLMRYAVTYPFPFMEKVDKWEVMVLRVLFSIYSTLPCWLEEEHCGDRSSVGHCGRVPFQLPCTNCITSGFVWNLSMENRWLCNLRISLFLLIIDSLQGCHMSCVLEVIANSWRTDYH